MQISICHAYAVLLQGYFLHVCKHLQQNKMLEMNFVLLEHLFYFIAH